ncbi:MAG: SMP-30/gluconolactonase/LRE family protein [Gemmatimonadota bacterium]|nr:SMP-30/gluconolactonase/LRE family protein [Gemmatimonadota bacterium]
MKTRLLLSSLAMLLTACGYQGERGENTERTQGDAEAEQMREGIRARAAEGVAIGYSTSEARFVRNIIGFQGPESAKYDAEQDVWFVTNMTGAGSVKDANGYISRISAANPDSAASVFIESGKNGVVLDSPKGMAMHGDTLWVADISILRAFDRHTGAPLANIDFAPLGAVQLNDVAVGPDGQIHVTDTGIMMSPKGVIHLGPDRVFTVGPQQQISVMATAPAVTWPNGITWNAVTKQWVIVSFDPFNGRIYSLAEKGDSAHVIREGAGRLDGVEVLANGALIFTSWADSSIHLLDHGTDRKLIRQVPEAADIGIDTKRHQLAIPLSVLGRVQIWNLGAIGQAKAP